MKRKLLSTVLGLGAMCVAVVLCWGSIKVQAAQGDRPIIYVTSQGLFYDSIVTAESLPLAGPFQKLEMGSNGLQTEFGPGDPGYLGGRWWIDADNNGEMDEGDVYFMCPLLGSGRTEP